jgi:hypothetical protein
LDQQLAKIWISNWQLSLMLLISQFMMEVDPSLLHERWSLTCVSCVLFLRIPSHASKNKSLKIFNILNLVIKLHNDFQPTMMFIIHVYVCKLQQCKKVLELIISLTNQTYKPTQVLFVVDVFPLEYNVGLMIM